MKPVVIHVATIFDLARAVLRVRSAAQEAIDATGAAKITIEPAQPGAVGCDLPHRESIPPLAAAAMARGTP